MEKLDVPTIEQINEYLLLKKEKGNNTLSFVLLPFFMLFSAFNFTGVIDVV